MKKASTSAKKNKTASVNHASKSRLVRASREVRVLPTSFDVMTAVLIVSLIINLFILCLWITLQVTDRYDLALFQFFVHR